MSEADPSASPVLYEQVTQHVVLVTLNRPEKRNAVNVALADALEEAVKRADADAEVRAVILTSSVDKVFCAGADLAAVAAGQARGLETPWGGFAGFVYAPRRKPWIAAVEGMALGGGFEIVLACDMVVASHNARFGLPEVKRSLIAGAGGVHRIANVLPRNLANELIATGDALEAERAHHFGLVNRLVPPGEAVEAARTLAESIAVNAPLAVQCALGAARASAGQADGFGRAVVGERFETLKLTEDYKEGPRAFVEKRDPVWQGR